MSEQNLTSVLAAPIVPVVPVAVMKLRYIELPPEGGESVWTFAVRTDKCTDEFLTRMLSRMGVESSDVDARDYLTLNADAFDGGVCTLMPGDFVVIHSDGSYNFIVGKGLTASFDGERLILTVN